MKSARPSTSAAASTSEGDSRSFAPFTTQIRFCPALSTKIGATPLDTPGVIRTLLVSIPREWATICSGLPPSRISLRDHGHVCAAETRRHCLIRALASKAKMEFASENGFTGAGSIVGESGQVDVRAPNHHDVRSLAH